WVSVEPVEECPARRPGAGAAQLTRSTYLEEPVTVVLHAPIGPELHAVEVAQARGSTKLQGHEAVRSGVRRHDVEHAVLASDDRLDAEDAARGLPDDDDLDRSLVAVAVLVFEARASGTPELLAGRGRPLLQAERLRGRMVALGDDREDRAARAARECAAHATRDRRVADDGGRAFGLLADTGHLALVGSTRVLHDERFPQEGLVRRSRPAPQCHRQRHSQRRPPRDPLHDPLLTYGIRAGVRRRVAGLTG